MRWEPSALWNITKGIDYSALVLFDKRGHGVFGSVLDAVNCAVEIQRELSERNAGLSYDRQMEFQIGINVGDVVEEHERLYGDGVNIAARIESLAQGGGICISGTASERIEPELTKCLQPDTLPFSAPARQRKGLNPTQNA